VLLITSPAEGDGKTTCALALAAMLAADGKRVLLIDADLRKANQSSYLHPADAPAQGLADVLRGEEGWGNVVTPIKVGVGQFYTLASGGTGPAELLSSKRMAELMEDVRKRCDFVLLDAPSFPAASDALVLSELVDTVLSVIRVGNTPRKVALEHLRALSGGAAAPVVVLNHVGQTAGGKVPRSRRADARAHDNAAPVAPRLARTRSLAWWVAGLMLAIAATAVAASLSPRTAELISAAIPFRHAG
jgi:Mrp family chromosome partitioning ATPase